MSKGLLKGLLRARETPPARVARLRLRAAWRRTLERLRPLGESSTGNQVTLFVDGDDAYDAMLASIEAARTRAWLETYIFEPDRVGRSFLDALLRARARGVDVVLLVDAFGSPRMGDAELAPLRAAGARVVVFNPPLSLKRRRPMLQRDHRKILVVDDVAFCGGMNISEEYAGLRRGPGRFRDTHALIEGPAAQDLAALVRSSAGAALVLPARRAPMEGGVDVQVLGSDVRRSQRHIQRALFHTIGRAQKSVWLTTPYFVPPPRLLRALERAARRGVDVKVLTAGLSDVPLVAAAARHLYGRLLRASVQVFEMTGRTLHAKTATIDTTWSMVGSFNLDRWSFERNLEVTFSVHARDLAARLEDCFNADLRLATEVDLAVWGARSRWERFLGWCAYQLARL